VGHSIHDRDRFQANVRPRQKKRNGHQVVAARVGVNYHNTLRRRSPSLRPRLNARQKEEKLQ
jgi:hypothetical protein